VPAAALVPTARELVPFAAAFTPQPSDEADAEAPLLLVVTLLTTVSDVADVVFRTFAKLGTSPVMTALGEVAVPAVKPTPEIALADPDALVKTVFVAPTDTLPTTCVGVDDP
jgi:hypothetical protein